jgi:hypothetical protein
MPTKKPKKHYFCPYCGREYEDNRWSYDHIIPLQMGGPKKFKVLACTSCNFGISRGIEQPAMQTPSMRDLVIHARSDGFKIRTRRKKDYIPLHRRIGFSGRMPVRVFYGIKENTFCLDFMGNLPQDMTIREFKKQLSHGQAIIPVDYDTEEDTVSLTSLINKIILGTCFWLWGEKFAGSRYGEFLRKRMWENKMEDIQELKPSDHHATLIFEENEVDVDIEEIEIDAFDNTPHNTIYIFAHDNTLLGLVNLFGELESLIRIGEVDSAIKLGIDQGGTIVIASTTKNQVFKMSLDEYMRLKPKKLSSYLVVSKKSNWLEKVAQT